MSEAEKKLEISRRVPAWYIKQTRPISSMLIILVLYNNISSKLTNCALHNHNSSNNNQSSTNSPANGLSLTDLMAGKSLPVSTQSSTVMATTMSSLALDLSHQNHQLLMEQQLSSSNCSNGLLTFELSTGFIYKPSSTETLIMMPSTLQLTDCLDYCLQNSSCLAINFEMGLCLLLSSSAKRNPANLYSSQFPVFTIYAEKKCLFPGEPAAGRQQRRCQRAWTFERVAGYEMKGRPRRRLKLGSRELCMEACLTEREFECRSANWYKQSHECTLSEQDRHSVSQSEAGDQQLSKSSLSHLYGPYSSSGQSLPATRPPPPLASSPLGLYENYYLNLADHPGIARRPNESSARVEEAPVGRAHFWKASEELLRQQRSRARQIDWYSTNEMPANAPVDYLENNCIYEPNKLCEFRKIQNKVLKTVDSIYQDVGSLDECKQKCLNAPYRCYSFDYGDTSDRVCRTSHLDQASLLSVKEPYLDVVGAITYELASCFNVTIQCRAREMVAVVSSSKAFKGKIYAKSRPNSCVNDVRESLKFELSMGYHDQACDVRASSSAQQGVFSNDIVIQHHDRIVTTQDVGLSVYCQYDLGNRSVTNNVDLAIERLEDLPQPGAQNNVESKNNQWMASPSSGSSLNDTGSPLVITSLATTVVKSPNVTMRITNMNGQPVSSATVGDRLALLFEIKEKTSPFGIFVREIIAMDGRQLMQAANNKSSVGLVDSLRNNNANVNKPSAGSYHYNGESSPDLIESLIQANRASSIQFIDSDGCPTDANIMGPLVKIDSSGQRLLAPFDAFKFPTSDMVFFRAVVSSCVLECKPAVCGAQFGPHPTVTEDELTTRTMAPTSSPISAKPSLKPPHVRPSVQVNAVRPTTVAQQTSTARPASGSASTLQPATRQTTLSHYSNLDLNSQPSGDSLTTIAGYSHSTVPDPMLASESALASAQQQQQVTNNHQQTRPMAPKPNLFDRRQPVNLSALSEVQRKQIVNLFETRLKQPLPTPIANGSSGLNDMADLYTGFLTQIMLRDKTLTGKSSPNQRRAGEPGTGNDLVHLANSSNELNIGNLKVVGQNWLASSGLEQGLDEKFLAELQQIIDQNNSSNSSNDIGQVLHPVETVSKTEQDANLGSQKKRKRDKLGLQAFADSYIGAFQSFGRRRKREIESDELLAPKYVRMVQPVVVPTGGIQFKHAVVELYHEGSQHHERRKKREAEPKYEVEELIIQSIKIHDRINFQKAQKRAGKAHRQDQAAKLGAQQAHLDQAEEDTIVPNARSVWASSSVLAMILIAFSFVCIQIFLVAMCLLDWRRTRKLRPRLMSDQARGKADLASHCESPNSTLAYLNSLARSEAELPQLYICPPTGSVQMMAANGDQQAIYVEVTRRQNPYLT